MTGPFTIGRELRARIPMLLFSRVSISGVEVTQAIQFQGADQHLTDSADIGPDNSITLVADKPAVVRVFVRTRFFDIPDVTGRMTIQRIKWGTWHDVEVITPEWPGRISAGPTPDYAATRLSMRRSLNFRIPGGRMHGLLRLKVEVWPASSAVTPTAENVVVLATLRQTLRLRGIPVQYSGPDASGNQIQLAAPTLADFQTTAAWTCNAWPVSPTPDITLAGALAWTTPLTGAIVNGTCPTSWNNLLAAVSNARVVDGNLTDRVYYALLPNGIPIGGAAGCGGSGAGAGSGFNGAGADMAHEIGHVLGFNHAPCGLPVGDTPDPNYPAYEPHDTTANRRASCWPSLKMTMLASSVLMTMG